MEEQHDALPAWQVERWLNGPGPATLDELRGRLVVLHTFQMLCPACVQHALPQAQRLHRMLPREQVAVLGLHTVFEHHAAMPPVALEAFLHEYRITHPVGVDTAVDGDPIPATMRAYGMQGTPTLVLLDRAGRIRLHQFGRVDDLPLGMLLGQLLAEDRDANPPMQSRGDAQ